MDCLEKDRMSFHRVNPSYMPYDELVFAYAKGLSPSFSCRGVWKKFICIDTIRDSNGT
jgi:hypothetical protein